MKGGAQKPARFAQRDRGLGNDMTPPHETLDLTGKAMQRHPDALRRKLSFKLVQIFKADQPMQ
jgi:hypothetical protein